MNDDPELVRDLQPSMFYSIETRGSPLSNGYFPRLQLERMFIRELDVDGIRFLEFQGLGGSRQVIEASMIERVVPLGRPAQRADTLRQHVCAQS
jgi:hypothetical protein